MAASARPRRIRVVSHKSRRHSRSPPAIAEARRCRRRGRNLKNGKQNNFVIYFALVVLFLLVVAVARADDQAAPQPPKKPEPFAFADFTWLTGNSRQHTPVF